MHSQPLIPNRGENAVAAAGSLRIAETFVSLQGEGKLTGTRSFFIRTSGCNLGVGFAIHPMRPGNPKAKPRLARSLVAEVLASGCEHVVFTGGEPMLPKDSVLLVKQLRDNGLHVTIETAGTIWRPLIADLMSISPKLAGSGPQGNQKIDPRWIARHEQTRWRPDVIAQLIKSAVDYQIKFVVDSVADLEQCDGVVQSLSLPTDHVWIMPQGIDEATLDHKSDWLRPLVAERGYQYCDRMHVRWYGNRRGT
jgi:7-carboxy-7-deazaguanine synthase